jgi:hypothetical protein
MRFSGHLVNRQFRCCQCKVGGLRMWSVPAITPNDRAAFEPLWWHSENSIEHIRRTVAHFVVAQIDDRVVGRPGQVMKRVMSEEQSVIGQRAID